MQFLELAVTSSSCANTALKPSLRFVFHFERMKIVFDILGLIIGNCRRAIVTLKNDRVGGGGVVANSRNGRNVEYSSAFACVFEVQTFEVA